MQKIILTLLSLFMLSNTGFAAGTMSIATGSPSGLYYPFGGGLASLWSRSFDDINMKAEVTSASVANIIQVARGESELGITQSDALRDAIVGRGVFPESMPIKVLLTLYPNVVHVMVPADSPIQSLQDLRDKKVAIGAAGSGNAVTSENVLSALGMSIDEDLNPVFLNYTETTDALKNGTIDAGIIVGGVGVSAVLELALSRDIRLVPVTPEDMQIIKTAFPAYSLFELPENTYHGIKKPTPSISLWNQLIVRADMPDALAEKLTKSALENPAELQKISKVARFTTAENTRLHAAGLLHPGAQVALEHLVQPVVITTDE